MFEIANIKTISRNWRYQPSARTASPSERFVVEYEVSAIQRWPYSSLSNRALWA
jgi:hypothetical protein